MKVVAILPLVAMLIGCDRTTIQTVEAVTSTAGNDRLIRKDWETVSYLRPEEKAWNSHSLVWQRLENGSWTDHLTITQDDFQRGNPYRRWVSSIHSFDPVSGIAILKIAEGDAPENSGAISYVYSWREWDIQDNREIKTISVCENPFEPYMDPQRP